jgi:hypothetical protein
MMQLMPGKSDDQFTEKEAKARFEAALRGGMKTSPKPHDEMKLGKPRGKKAKSPAKPKVKKVG